MTRFLGSLDDLARTLAALLTFFLVQKLEADQVPLPDWVEFVIAVAVGTVVSAVFSRWLWGRPSVDLTWKAQNAPHVGPSARILTQAPRDQRVWTLEVVRSSTSLLGWMVLRRMLSHNWSLRTDIKPSNVFFVTAEYSTGLTPPTFDHAGFSVPLEGLGSAGPTVTVEMEWEPRANPQRVLCQLTYTLQSSGRTSTRLARMVKINRNVESIELMRGT